MRRLTQIGLLVTGSFAFGLAAALTQSTQVSSDEVFSNLTTRGQLLSRSRLSYRQYSATVSRDDWESAKARVAQSHATPDSSLMDRMSEWLNGVSPTGPLESWVGTIVVNGRESTLRRNRGQDDTTMAHLQAAADAASANLVRRPSKEWIEVKHGSYLAVHDARTLTRKPAADGQWPLLPVDCTLGPWADAVGSTPLPGQEYFVESISENSVQLLISNVTDHGTARTSYRFSPSWEWAPLSVHQDRNGVLTTETLYGYTHHDNSPMRPRVTLRGVHRPGNTVLMKLFIVNDWSLEPDLQDMTLRLPPARIEILDDGETDLVIIKVLPDWLTALSLEDRVSAAVELITLNIGTDAAEADFNADGHVDGLDITHAVQVIP